MRKLYLALAVLVVLALGGVGLGYYLYKRHQSRNIHGSPTVEFVTTEKQHISPEITDVPWPMYGFDEERTRYDPEVRLRPPYRGVWTFRAQSLLEFPPAIAYRRLYFTSNAGVVYAISARTGKRAWKRPQGRCVAASPAVAKHRVFQTFLNRPPCNATGSGLEGEIVAFAAGTGRVLWRKQIGPSESSPVWDKGRVYVGDWNGDVWSLNAGTGQTKWVFHTGGQVKGGVTISGGRVYVGNYDGHLYALDAKTGRKLWQGSSQGRLGGSGNFYSTPAVAYGRVYVGSTDGKVYAFGATSGKLRWSHSTGGYVYSSPAVWNKRVYFGSYSGTFYAFDAATGDVAWTFSANGPISGSPTVLDGVVYLATLKRRTYALDARTGKQLWSWPDGKYSPVVADTKRLYLVGYARIYGFVAR